MDSHSLDAIDQRLAKGFRMPHPPLDAASREAAMRAALAEAELAHSSGDVPVGAVLLDADGSVLALARNEREKLHDPTAHAEVLAIRRGAQARGDWRLTDTTLVVTLEPCVLCAGAILSARIPRLVFGAWDEKAGAVGSVHDLLRDRRSNHRVEVLGGVLEAESSALLTDFFRGGRRGSELDEA